MEDRKRLIVKGFVQGVGYRAFVRFMARRYGIKGRVKNLENGDVEIIAVGDEKSMDVFIKSINIHAESPFEPDVHDIVIEEYSGNELFESFYVDYGYDMSVAEKEMIERSEIGILAFGWMGKYLGNKIDRISEKIDGGFAETGEKIDMASEKIDTMSEKMDKGFSDIGEKIDTVGEKIDGVNEKLDTLTKKIESGFDRTYGKLDEISSKLDVSTERTGELQREMTEKFDYLDVKYGEFSATLKSMLERFDNLEKDVKEIKDAFLKLVDYITEKG